MSSFRLTKLVNRKLIRISGPDCYSYLQSLFSNDLRYLYEPDRVPKRQHAFVSSNVLSTFMLNAQGRVICDLLLYRTPNTNYQCGFSPPGEAKEPDELLIECDSSIANGLANTLYAYRVRRKVSLELAQDLNVWCLFPVLGEGNHPTNHEQSALQDLKSAVLTKEVVENDVTMVNDPRLDLMGVRILSNSSYDFAMIKHQIGSKFNVFDINETSVKRYILHKYSLGIGEGSEDHPEGNCLPLECNADLLGSVSFDKGCYLGQELTARIHYTGVIRKRLMPVVLTIDKSRPPPEFPFAPGSDIVDIASNKKVGVIRNITHGRGLALLRHNLINESSKLVHEATKVPVNAWKPHWWNVAD